MKRLKHAFWWVLHGMVLSCPLRHIKTEWVGWNPAYPYYITPRHTCMKCGRSVHIGKVHASRPWPEPRDG